MDITAPFIHDGNTWLAKGSTISINDDGVIAGILSQPTKNTVFYEGIICPCFVNAHCHLELSHMKGLIPEGTGLISFLKQVIYNRNIHSSSEKETAKELAYQTLIENGVIAIGDIANTTDTLSLRQKGDLHFHTFIEAIGFSETNADKSFQFAKQIFDQFNLQIPKAGNIVTQSITPHAPYSVSMPLFKMIQRHSPNLMSVHNQESTFEDEYFINKTGPIVNFLHELGIDDSFFKPSGLSSIQTYMEHLDVKSTYLFVHNTYTSNNDILYISTYFPNSYWCLCPNANLYIESRLPDLNELILQTDKICIGTDSLASNHKLSVWSELQTIHKYYPSLSWETLIRWATFNGAKALNMQESIGRIQEGNKPGLLQIKDLESGSDNNLLRIV